MKNLYLGIDTSNYKTSVAVTDELGNVLFQKSELLPVKQGERGLRQSDAFFQHCNRLPEYMESAFSVVDSSDICSIGVSSKPRRIEGSYMPCFLAGINTARILGASLGIPVYEFSHQEGHASAVLNPIMDQFKEADREPFLFFHLSGGTTEFLLCEKDDSGYSMTKVGGTKDISIGQLLDRIGVAMDFSFPSGKYLDEIASGCNQSSSMLPHVKLNDGYFNLSGIETKVLRYIKDNNDRNTLNPVVSEVFDMIAGLLYNSSLYLADKFKVSRVVIAGGVGASRTIRSRILACKPSASLRRLNTRKPEIIFGDSELCGDNAIGISHLARMITEK